MKLDNDARIDDQSARSQAGIAADDVQRVREGPVGIRDRAANVGLRRSPRPVMKDQGSTDGDREDYDKLHGARRGPPITKGFVTVPLPTRRRNMPDWREAEYDD